MSTRFENKQSRREAGEVNDWIQKNLTLPRGTSVLVQPSFDGSQLEKVEIGARLSDADKTKLVTQYPELAGKEI